MPFAELGGGVAGALEAGGEGRLAVKALERAPVGLDAEAALEFPDHEACARRHALRGGAVAVFREHAAAREGVDVRVSRSAWMPWIPRSA